MFHHLILIFLKHLQSTLCIHVGLLLLALCWKPVYRPQTQTMVAAGVSEGISTVPDYEKPWSWDEQLSVGY